MHAIELNDLKYAYASGERPVIDIKTWQVPLGEQVFLHGPSGCGKSTLLNLLAGVLRPNSGSIQLLQQDVSALSSRKMDKFRARHIGVVFQQFNLISYLTVGQNIQLAAHFGGSAQDDEKMLSLLDALKLPKDISQRIASELSVGQQQRVAIARALINSPEILIVDEPTSALDADARDAFMTLLTAICKEQQTTLIFVSHDRALAEYFEHQVDLTELQQAVVTQ